MADNQIQNANDNDTYLCNCGCNLIFEAYSVGCDIYVGNEGMIAIPQMVSDYSWGSYIPQTHNQWYQLKEFIITKYNICKDDGKEGSKGWIHLYNRFCIDDRFNGNDKLYYEQMF